jgi:three-Cys-motif partner protein
MCSDDGLVLPEVGHWAEDKHRVVETYANLFATGMKRKWDCRVFIDLFAGAGRCRIKNTERIVDGSPLIALGVDDPFDVHIFCEYDQERLSALQQRVATRFPDATCFYVQGDSNDLTDEVLSHVPIGSRDYRVLTFCLVDPYKMGNLRFSTLEAIAGIYVDFLVLIPDYMDAHRNVRPYLSESNTTVSGFLGDPNWRDKWAGAERESVGFGAFVADALGQQMRKLRFLYPGPEEMFPIKDTERNLLLYHLAFFSRNNVAGKFWKQSQKYSKDQLDLF